MKQIFTLMLLFVLVLTAVAAAGELEDALFHAIGYGKVELVRVLIDRGVDVNAKNEKGCTVLSFAEQVATDSFFAAGYDEKDPDYKNSEETVDLLKAAGAVMGQCN